MVMVILVLERFKITDFTHTNTTNLADSCCDSFFLPHQMNNLASTGQTRRNKKAADISKRMVRIGPNRAVKRTLCSTIFFMVITGWISFNPGSFVSWLVTQTRLWKVLFFTFSSVTPEGGLPSNESIWTSTEYTVSVSIELSSNSSKKHELKLVWGTRN